MSDGAFFNVIGSRMDAYVITSNEHQQIMFQPSKLNIMMMSIQALVLNIMMKSMIDESEAKLEKVTSIFIFCLVILSSSQILTMISPATMIYKTMIMMIHISFKDIPTMSECCHIFDGLYVVHSK